MKSLELAILFHETYERLAPDFGYETRIETRKFDQNTPNGKLMVAVCAEILQAVGYEENKARITELEATVSAQKEVITNLDAVIDEQAKQVAELRRVLGMVEWEYVELESGTMQLCLWCGEEPHAPNCPRQKVLNGWDALPQKG